MKLWFQHTAAETRHIALAVSTHSRLKAADRYFIHIKITCIVSTHSRLEAADQKVNVLGFSPVFQHTAA